MDFAPYHYHKVRAFGPIALIAIGPPCMLIRQDRFSAAHCTMRSVLALVREDMTRSVINRGALPGLPWGDDMLGRFDCVASSLEQDEKDTNIMRSMDILDDPGLAYSSMTYATSGRAPIPETDICDANAVLIVSFDLHPIHFIVGQDIFERKRADIIRSSQQIDALFRPAS